MKPILQPIFLVICFAALSVLASCILPETPMPNPSAPAPAHLNQKANLPDQTILSGQASLSGRARIVDGDGLWVNGLEIRLSGIDAPELYQSCFDKGGKSWPCGFHSKQYLQDLARVEITCALSHQDRYGRTIASCYQSNGAQLNLAIELVRAGMAIAAYNPSPELRQAEQNAKMRQIGIWQGAFKNPAQWRRDRWRR